MVPRALPEESPGASFSRFPASGRGTRLSAFPDALRPMPRSEHSLRGPVRDVGSCCPLPVPAIVSASPAGAQPRLLRASRVRADRATPASRPVRRPSRAVRPSAGDLARPYPARRGGHLLRARAPPVQNQSRGNGSGGRPAPGGRPYRGLATPPQGHLTGARRSAVSVRGWARVREKWRLSSPRRSRLRPGRRSIRSRPRGLRSTRETL